MAQVLRASSLLLVATIWCSTVIAQGYPTKPIKLIVTFSPGGFTDVTARIVAQHWTERFGQPVVVENKPGASTVIGTDAVAKAAPDGLYARLHRVSTQHDQSDRAEGASL